MTRMALIQASVLSTLLVGLSCCSQGVAEAGGKSAGQLNGLAGPRLVIINGAQAWDAGIRKRGDRITKVFQVRNTDPNALTVSRLVRTCGCTKASISPQTIGPGDTAALELDVDTSGKSGRMITQVHVFGGAPEAHLLDVTVTAVVEGSTTIAYAEPSSLHLGKIGPDDRPTCEVSLVCAAHWGSSLPTLRQPQSPSVLGTEIVLGQPTAPTQDGEGLIQRYTLQLRLPDKKPIGLFVDRISVACEDGGGQPQITVSVTAEVAASIVLSEESVFIDRAHLGQPEQRDIKVVEISPSAIQGLRLYGEDDWVEAQLLGANADASLWTVRIKAVGKQQGFSSSAIHIVSGESQLILPVKIYVE
jgi:hypothetical protein